MICLRRLIRRNISKLRVQLKIGYSILNKRNLKTKKKFKQLLEKEKVNTDNLTKADWCYHQNIVAVYPRTTIFSLNPFKVVGCTKCGLEFREKIPSIDYLDKYNELFTSGDYYFLHSKSTLNGIDREKKEEILFNFVQHLKILSIDKYVNEPKRYLEIGCGQGYTVALMQDWGFEAYAIDISDWAVNYMKNELGIKNAFKYRDLKEAKFANDFFGFIHLGHTIEHIIDPIDTLKEIYRILAKDGLLFLITPDSDLDRMTYYYREHLYFFNEYALKYWLNVIGFRNIEIYRDAEEKHILESPSFIILARK